MDKEAMEQIDEAKCPTLSSWTSHMCSLPLEK